MIAKIQGARVIGIAGGKKKCDWVRSEAGFDAAIDYKSEVVGERLAELCPNGIDVYFDNVGGDHLEAAIACLRDHGRIAACGSISRYNDETPQPGPRNLFQIVTKRLTIRGFIVLDWLRELKPFQAEVAPLIVSGKIKAVETVVDGLDKAPEAFLSMLKGGNVGKMVVKI